MLVRVWRFVTLMMLALSMGLALSHLLEMRAKRRYDGGMWLELLHTLYADFGTYGAVFEVGALLTSITLVFLVRNRGHSFWWTLTGAALIILTQFVFWLRVAPVNAEMAQMDPGALSAGWQSLRDQWEYGHATRAVLQVCAVASIVISILVETPTNCPRHQLGTARVLR